MIQLKLYIASRSPQALETSETVRKGLEGRFGRDFSLDVINVLERPDLAMADNVMATPTIIRRAPEPQRRVMGNLRDLDRVFGQLGLLHGDRAEKSRPIL